MRQKEVEEQSLSWHLTISEMTRSIINDKVALRPSAQPQKTLRLNCSKSRTKMKFIFHPKIQSWINKLAYFILIRFREEFKLNLKQSEQQIILQLHY